MREGGFAVRPLAADEFARLAAGAAPAAGLELPEPPIAPPGILAMLAAISEELRGVVEPNAWIVLDGRRIVALCSITGMVEPGVPRIGYGTAPGEEGRGAASAGVAAILDWASDDPQIDTVFAETGIGNRASQRVLERNGFAIVGEREDPEDGSLLCWSWETPAGGC